MKKKLAIGLGVVVGVVLVVLAIASTRPDSVTVTRSAHIDAPPPLVVPYVTDFELWGRWNPWDKVDPNIRKTYGPKRAGVGARYEWDGNDKVGSGWMQIDSIDSTNAGTTIVHDHLVFLRPFASDAQVEFRVEPDGNGSKVTWRMTSPQNLVSKTMGLFVDMDAMLGREFEKGLATLGTIVR